MKLVPFCWCALYSQSNQIQATYLINSQIFNILCMQTRWNQVGGLSRFKWIGLEAFPRGQSHVNCPLVFRFKPINYKRINSLCMYTIFMYTEYAFHCNCSLPFPFRTELLSLIHSCFVSPAGDEIPCKGDIVDGGHGHQFLRGPGWTP